MCVATRKHMNSCTWMYSYTHKCTYHIHSIQKHTQNKSVNKTTKAFGNIPGAVWSSSLQILAIFHTTSLCSLWRFLALFPMLWISELYSLPLKEPKNNVNLRFKLMWHPTQSFGRQRLCGRKFASITHSLGSWEKSMQRSSIVKFNFCWLTNSLLNEPPPKKERGLI